MASPVGKALFVAMANRIGEGIEAGKIRSMGKTAEGVAQSVWAAIHGLVALRLAYPDFDWLPIDDQIDLHIDMLLRGLVVADDDAKPKKAAETVAAPAYAV